MVDGVGGIAAMLGDAVEFQWFSFDIGFNKPTRFVYSIGV